MGGFYQNRSHLCNVTLSNYWIPKYKILSASELPTVNLQLLDTFQSYIEDDDDYPNDASSSANIYCRIEPVQLDASVLSGELPTN